MIVNDNILCLKQGALLIQNLSREHYPQKEPQCFHSSIGGHVRHILDHYHCFFHGLDQQPARIDYDGRPRDNMIEENPDVAAQKIEAVCRALKQLTQELNLSVQVKMDTGSDYDDQWAQSTLHRELQFLLSHTVHHYALIATICARLGVSVAPDFGVAPSTLRYRRETER